MKTPLRTAPVLMLAVLLIAAIGPLWSPTSPASALLRVNDRDFTATNEILGPHTLIPSKVAVDSGVFLVANTHLNSQTFSRTVILVVEHGEQGSLGLIINRPSDMSLTQLVPKAKELGSTKDDVVYFGGPVSSDAIVLLLRARSPLAPEQAIRVFDDIYLSSSSSVLERLLGRDDSEDMFHAYVGYAGWAPGQLSYEIKRGDWFVVPGDAEKIFSADPESIWPQMIKALSGQWVLHLQLTSCLIAPV